MKIDKKGTGYVAKCNTCGEKIESQFITDIKWRIRMHDAKHSEKLSKWIK